MIRDIPEPQTAKLKRFALSLSATFYLQQYTSPNSYDFACVLHICI